MSKKDFDFDFRFYVSMGSTSAHDMRESGYGSFFLFLLAHPLRWAKFNFPGCVTQGRGDGAGEFYFGAVSSLVGVSI